MTYLEVNDDGYLALHDVLPTSVEATLLAVVRRFWDGSRIYDRDGNVWRPVPEPSSLPRPSWSLRLLAYTVYNPRRCVLLRCERAGQYQLSDLKGRIAAAVDRDDDVLTQFMEASEIHAVLAGAQSFSDVIELVRCMEKEADDSREVAET